MRKGEEIVVETESKGRDDEVSGDEEVLDSGAYTWEGQRYIDGEIPGAEPFPERGVVPSVLHQKVNVDSVMLVVHAAARMNELAAVEFAGRMVVSCSSRLGEG